MNTSGGRVSEVLTNHQTVYRDIWAKVLPAELPEFDDFVDEGAIYREQLREILHEERDPHDFDRDAMRAWLRHGWKTDALVARMATMVG
jgi:hypothetical protein